MMLGKRPAKHDPRTFSLVKYLSPSWPPPPLLSRREWSPAVTKHGSYRMHQNDVVGCCVFASSGHQIATWTGNALKEPHHVRDSAVLDAYRAVSGYNPSDPTTDVGAVVLDGLKFWRKHGIDGHKIGAFVSVSPRDRMPVMHAINLFGGLKVGLLLPLSAQNQEVWDVPAGGATSAQGKPESWGGHCVAVVDYDWTGLRCVTWGGVKKITWAFFKTYCDEAYATLSQDFFHGGEAPNGFSIDELRADLARVSS